jgi:DNA polymerase I-like protein with 3'-5' exonuclease and polymerase domains
LSLVLAAVTRRHRVCDQARSEFEQAHSVSLSSGRQAARRGTLEKVFEDRQLRRAYLEMMRTKLTTEAFGRLARTALADRIGAMGNAFRNAPIQGGVADVALEAYGRLAQVLGSWNDVWPVQTVHDSITLEVDARDAVAVAVALRDAMEAAMAGFCPDVPAVADADIRTSLDDGSVVVEIGRDTDLVQAAEAVRQAVER